MRRIPIDEFVQGCKNSLLLDVRSPGEYTHAHLPGAVSLPLFTDEERKVVGTAYKQESRVAAIKIGLDYFGPKMRGVVEEVERIWNSREQIPSKSRPPKPEIFLYCWRGGMRSGAVAWLLNLYGFSVTVLAGGYKAFRNWALKMNSEPFRLQVLGGYTGSGKSILLKELESSGKAVLHLEELASHKGSAFGNINMPPQPSQEMFENMLAMQLFQLTKKAESQAVADEPIWLEDESQRIGHINIPNAFWENMRRSPVCFLDIPFEERLQNLVAEYGGLDKEKMAAAIQRISKRLGPLETKTALQFLEEDAIEACFRILLQYYDKRYQKGLHNRDGLDALLIKIPCKKVSVENAALVSQAQGSNYAGTN